MTTYYEVKAVNRHDNETEVLYGSFNKSDCKSELEDEKDSWKVDYKHMQVVSRETEDTPDPDVYPELYPKQLTDFNEMKCLPLFEFALPDDEYLVVNLTADNKGITFTLDVNTEDLNVAFDGEIETINGAYFLAWDDCFELDHHLQMISENITEGFLIPNNLFM